MKARALFIAVPIAIMLILDAIPSAAGVHGKIAGRVVDEKTREGLIGANVSVTGTNLGATTDMEGNYVILDVPPRLYSLRISYIGYTTKVVREVKVVQDLTTEINVELAETYLELGEVVEVVAERPLIHKEVSASAITVSSDEFRNRPIESIQSVVNTSAGVVSFQGQSFIRGSRWTDVAYVVDGVPLTNPITGGLMTDVSKNAVEEIVLLTGGFSAEYGNAMGGVVNVTTKDGGSKMGGSLRYKSDKIMSRSQYYQNLNVWDLTVGGPIYGGIKFFATGYLNVRNMNPQREVIAPDGTDLGRHPHEGYQEYRTNVKLTVPLSRDLKIQFTGSQNRAQQLLYNLYWRFGSDANQLDRYGALWQKTRFGALIVNHLLSSTTFYTAKLGYLDWHSINGQRDRSEWSGLAESANGEWWKDFKFRKPFYDRNYRLPNDPNVYSKWRLRDSQGVDDVYSPRTSDSVSVNNPYGVPGGIQNTVDADYFQSFVWSGDRDWYEENRNRQLSFRFDLTSQPSASHEIKSGFEIITHRVNRFRIGAMAALNGLGITYPIIDFYEKSPTDTALTISDVEDLGDGYTPIEAAAYATYQVRLKGMYINLGLRYDYYKAQTRFRLNPLQPDESSPFKQARLDSRSKSQFSPRLGISFPVTDRILLRFNYGHFFQRPPMDRLFSYLWIDLNQADVNQGNPNIDPQKTVAYEIGLSGIVRDDLALDITAFQKNMFNLEGYRMFRAPDLEWYFLAVNEEYGESRGVEVTLRKRYSHWTSGSLTYTLSYARGTSSDVTQVSRYPLTALTYAKELGYDPIYPQDTMPMDFDRRHAMYLIFDFSVPMNEGPELLGFKPLSGFGLNLTGIYQAGTPYTPMTSYFVNLTTDRFNSANYPSSYSFDTRLRKDVPFLGTSLSIFAEIYNVFNFQKAHSVFRGSGNPDEPSYSVTKGSISPDSYPSGHPLYSRRADTNGDAVLDADERIVAYQSFERDMLAFRRNYPLPRRVLIGLEIRW